jgi:phytoene desaturase
VTTAVVVGAGVGGLAVAARLAAGGHRVTVVEQADAVGGKLGWWCRDGVGFDTGPSLLTLPQVLRDTFTETGGWPESLVLHELSPISRVQFADGSGFEVHRDLDRLCTDLDAWSPGAGADWRRIALRAQRIWEAVHGPFLERELHGARTLLGLALRHPRALPLVAPWQSLAGLGAQFLRDPRLQQFLWRYATYAGSDPRRAPAALASIPYAEHQFGGWYVTGGLRRIADELAARARERGARIRLQSDVRRVLVEGGHAAGVELADGERLRAELVVCNADAGTLYAELLEAPQGRRSATRLAQAPRSYSGLAVLLGVRGERPAAAAQHTVLLPRNYSAEFDALAAGRMPADPAIYVSIPDDPAVAADGVHPWFVLLNAPRSDQPDATLPGAAEVLDLLAERGLDVRDRVAFAAVRTPHDLAVGTRSPGGAIYGTSSDGPRAAFLRPANRSPVPGLFLVGGSAHPGGGLPLVLLSAAIVARLIGPARAGRAGPRATSSTTA